MSKHHLPKHWVGCPTEEEFFGQERKEGKKQRKLATQKDRSKYKKTDQEKLQKQTESRRVKNPEAYKKGRVLSIKPEGIIVEREGRRLSCTLRGALKKDKSLFKNLITVGDFVLFEEIGSGEGSIVQVEERHSVLSRADNLSRKKEQLIAANIDQVLITVSVVLPLLRPSLVDRYIIAARKGNMVPIIVVNKTDLLSSNGDDPDVAEQRELYKEFLEAYAIAKISVIPISAATGEGLDALREIMRGKASVFSGQSGVGKSSLINSLTGSSLKVGKAVEKTQKGAHTTTTAQLIPLEIGGWCIDTPGIKSFGVWSLREEEIADYFSEIAQFGKECKYPDCSHSGEEDCNVIIALERGDISPIRYESYLSLMESIKQEHLRR